ncbi:MAG TPA: YdcH family protein [Vicinamibacterales bacterium]|nr:YdcH family protein [Vicinamibacterales bacterium]
MPTDFEELKRQLLQTDEEFRQLASQHHALDEKIHSLAARHYLSEPEQFEATTLKKRKLQLKDQMESILRRHVVSRGPAHAAQR